MKYIIVISISIASCVLTFYFSAQYFLYQQQLRDYVWLNERLTYISVLHESPLEVRDEFYCQYSSHLVGLISKIEEDLQKSTDEVVSEVRLNGTNVVDTYLRLKSLLQNDCDDLR
ncbi:hypothetical protein DFR27_1014 [Umboniibacter marinipuniceus]|uniref:Uncharacterized protein n=1 Tax=Umboniibacter marinipuniceus TaxID=569599 RepID=A0A3M0AC79_9GAMM|nr:hypothetical protein DFR27_1014 [Umboniibacter marinipuniceus]